MGLLTMLALWRLISYSLILTIISNPLVKYCPGSSNPFLTTMNLARPGTSVTKAPCSTSAWILKSSIIPHQLSQSERQETRPPLILWNHRWEYDKNPEEFFSLLYRLEEDGIDFQVAVLGECFAQKPEVFLEASEKLKDRIVQFGFVNNFADYATWLWKADIIPVTSRHDFFGASVVQALYCNCYPLLPKRLSYPEHLPKEVHSRFFYDDFDDLTERIKSLMVNIQEVRQEKTQLFVENYDWQIITDSYDKVFNSLL